MPPPHDVAGSKVFLYVINNFFKGIPKNILDFTQFLFFAEKLVVKRQLVIDVDGLHIFEGSLVH